MRLPVLLKLSLRSVGRNARRSALTAAAMAVGLALLIFSRGLAEGGHEQWIDSAVRLAHGHVAVQAPRYLETQRLEHRMEATQVDAAMEALESEGLRDRIVEWAPRLSVTGLASSAAAAVPVLVHGVDPEREAAFSDIQERVIDGRYLEEGDRLRAYVGVELARRLELEPGERFVLTAQGVGGEVVGQLVRVAGVFRSGVPEMDQGLVHIPLETARTWLSAPGALTSVALLLRTSRETEEVAGTLADELARADVRVLGWRESSPELDSAVRIDDYGDYLFHTVLFAIVALAILNAVMMSVLNRRREFGILQALGLTGAETGLIVFGEGLFLTLASGVVGMVLGYAFTFGLFAEGLDFSRFVENEMSFSGGVVETTIVPMFSWTQIGLSVGFILAIGSLSSIYPALRATRLDVAEAVKFEQ